MVECILSSDENTSSASESNTTGTTAFSLPGWQLALWAMAYLFLILVAVTGNITVIWIILGHKRMRTVTNYFIVNLALADTCMATFNVAFNFVYASHNVWYFGQAFCHSQNFFPIMAMFVSIYSMMAIAVDRYMAIIHPFQARMSTLSTKVIIGAIWLVASGLAFPQFFYSTVTEDEGATKCIVDWPKDSKIKLLVYHLTVIVLTYFLPLVVMFVTYSIIGVTLWRQVVPGKQLLRVQQGPRHIAAKKRFVKTMVVVVVTFAICWLPYHLYFILGTFRQDIYCHKFIQQVYLALFWLAMSSTMYNPIIYCCLNQRFRSGFRLAFRCCPWVTPTDEDKLKLFQNQSILMTSHKNHTKMSLSVRKASLPETPNNQEGDLGYQLPSKF
ncbi:substance-K receptor [Dromiciops gliroides]|uniref:substance-K receptor n=1 Tax=Dromiciops gliroides TaxID=33562 RepID=UPI001CC467DC|nr:substance-K receptor [Dromiciops gliroides]